MICADLETSTADDRRKIAERVLLEQGYQIGDRHRECRQELVAPSSRDNRPCGGGRVPGPGRPFRTEDDSALSRVLLHPGTRAGGVESGVCLRPGRACLARRANDEASAENRQGRRQPLRPAGPGCTPGVVLDAAGRGSEYSSPGGGRRADLVRGMDRIHGLGEEKSHWLAAASPRPDDPSPCRHTAPFFLARCRAGQVSSRRVGATGKVLPDPGPVRLCAQRRGSAGMSPASVGRDQRFAGGFALPWSSGRPS